MKILVLDDSKTMRIRIGKVLKELGHEVREASNGYEGLLALRAETGWTVVLVDLNMPGMNGFDFIAAVRADPQYKSAPIIVVTGETRLSVIKRAMKTGANEYIMKPFNKEALLQKFAILGLGETKRSNP